MSSCLELWPDWLSACFQTKHDLLLYDDDYQSLMTPKFSLFSCSCLPWHKRHKRPTKRATSDRASTHDSLRSLLVDDRDAELFGDESINLLLTANLLDSSTSDVPIDSRPAMDDAELLQEEEALRLAEETEVMRNRNRARTLAIERGLLEADVGGAHMTRNIQPCYHGAASMSATASVESREKSTISILPHMRPF